MLRYFFCLYDRQLGLVSSPFTTFGQEMECVYSYYIAGNFCYKVDGDFTTLNRQR